MRPLRLVLVAAAALLVAACSSGAGATGSPSSPPTASPASTRIEVTLSDDFTIEPASMTVPAGVPVTFVVSNAGAIVHEFLVGDEAAQAEHEQEMLAGGMGHDEPNGIAVDPGQTKELTVTFEEPGETLAGCHEAGHYAAGMKAPITVSG
ncbi:MAG: cupredoxin domain-containing protein [Chloroflexi bacterium]|nr:cupredoxin domain-containing protein [Chloroflexota bacterium]